jgi:hypothetical protein
VHDFNGPRSRRREVSTEFYWIAVVLTTIVSASRLTRLATVDVFPPVAWARQKYVNATIETDWKWLVLCGYCFSFWATALVIGSGLWAGVYGGDPSGGVWTHVWWIVNGALAASYLAAILMALDADTGDDGDED